MSNSRVISCNSPYGKGGIGQHLAFLVEQARQSGELSYYISNDPEEGDQRGRKVTSSLYGLLTYTPLRFSPSWKNYLINERFDRAVAASLKAPSSTSAFMGFAGKSLKSFQRATDLGFKFLELVAPNSHVENVYELHKFAHRESGIRDSWLNRMQVRKTLNEYHMADRIYVHSDYVAASLTERGIPSRKLVHTRLPVDERFAPPAERKDDGVFRIAYIGRIDATKGIPLLMKAFQRLPIADAELRLVGGWSTRRMRKYMERKLSEDRRITVRPGDPQPFLHKADVLVHPTYEDGFGYAPMEALTCGVPVIVTEDTGMKEYVLEGENGFVIPTGNVDSLIHRLMMIYSDPLTRNHPLVEPEKTSDPELEARSANN